MIANNDIKMCIDNYLRSYSLENDDGLTKKEIFLKTVYDFNSLKK